MKRKFKLQVVIELDIAEGDGPSLLNELDYQFTLPDDSQSKIIDTEIRDWEEMLTGFNPKMHPRI